MSLPLPDVCLDESPSQPAPLSWVGMGGIDLPLRLDEPGCQRLLDARVDAQVDLPDARAKGIHMSRLHRQLDHLGVEVPLSPARVQALLSAMIHSHADCGSRRARVQLGLALPVRRPALRTPGLAGWKTYPVRIAAGLDAGGLALRVQVAVTYSSTCPCSAALARAVVADAFLRDFQAHASVDTQEVTRWLRANASLATPHSQRSVAQVAIDVPAEAAGFGLLALIDRVEAALGTPVQTAVKREDEQAFAIANGANLMFVEDAARRILAALEGRYARPGVQVTHAESLHAHDAVAWAGAPLEQAA